MDIKVFENSMHDASIPNDFSNFIINEDTKKILKKKITFTDNYGEEELLLHTVYDVKDNEENIIENYEFHLDENIENGIIPFAEDEGGNLICISARINKDKGTIYFVDHEYDIYDDMHMTVIANSFTEFIFKLKDK